MHPLILLPLLLLAPARADETLCIACCQNAGLPTCRPRLRVFGEGSRVTSEQGSWRVHGLWILSCDGTARFEPGSGGIVPSTPVDGQVVLADTPLPLLACFERSCVLPPQACLRSEASGRARLVDCVDGIPLTGGRLRREAAPLAGDVETEEEEEEDDTGIRADPPRPAPPLASAPPAPVAAPPRPVAAPPPVAVAAPVVVAAPPAPPPPPPSPVPAPRSPAVSPGSTVAIDVPTPPLSLQCTTPDALRDESRRRLDLGDEEARQGRTQRAVDEYRAALALDRCNGYAWAALGATAARAGQPDKAAAALAQAVQLLPRHYNAWTDLGVAYEALGKADLARAAYKAALQARPGHLPAEQALQRLGQTPGR